MYEIKAVLKSGATVVMATAETIEGAEKKLDRLELDIMDPTVAKHVFRDGTTMTVVKDISAVYVEKRLGD